MTTRTGSALARTDVQEILGGIGTAIPGPLFLVDEHGRSHALNGLATDLGEDDGLVDAFVSPVSLGADRPGRLVGYTMPGAGADDAPLVSALVALAAGVLSRRLGRRAEAPSRPREATEAVLDDACAHLATLLDETEVASVTARAARRALGAAAVAVLLPSTDGSLRAVGTDGVAASRVRRVRRGSGILGRATDRGEALAIESPWRVPEGLGGERESGGCRFDAWLAPPLAVVPLRCGPQLSGLLVVSGLPATPGQPAAADAAHRLQRLADRTAASLAGARLVGQVRRQERLARELEIARQIQAALLLDTTARFPGLDVAGECRSSAPVGGDYLGFRRDAPDELTATVFDVAGHGIGAAFCMTLVRSTLQGELARGDALGDALERANRLVHDDVATSGLFATAFVARFDRKAGLMRYVSAGHLLPIHWRASERRFVEHPEGGLPLGLLADGAPPEAVTPFGEGDVFLATTDGIVEATNAAGEKFGRHRLLGIVARSRRRPARVLLKRIWRELSTFLGGTPLVDDATVAVVCGRPGFGTPRPAPRSPRRVLSCEAPLAGASRGPSCASSSTDDTERVLAPTGAEPVPTR